MHHLRSMSKPPAGMVMYLFAPAAAASTFLMGPTSVHDNGAATATITTPIHDADGAP